MANQGNRSQSGGAGSDSDRAQGNEERNRGSQSGGNQKPTNPGGNHQSVPKPAGGSQGGTNQGGGMNQDDRNRPDSDTSDPNREPRSGGRGDSGRRESDAD